MDMSELQKQREALGNRRSEIIKTTDDPNRQTWDFDADANERSRAVNRPGSKENKHMKSNKAQYENWSNFHQLQDNEVLEEDSDAGGGGQLHRAQLTASRENVPAATTSVNLPSRGNRGARGGRISAMGRGGRLTSQLPKISGPQPIRPGKSGDVRNYIPKVPEIPKVKRRGDSRAVVKLNDGSSKAVFIAPSNEFKADPRRAERHPESQWDGNLADAKSFMEVASTAYGGSNPSALEPAAHAKNGDITNQPSMPSKLMKSAQGHGLDVDAPEVSTSVDSHSKGKVVKSLRNTFSEAKSVNDGLFGTQKLPKICKESRKPCIVPMGDLLGELGESNMLPAVHRSYIEDLLELEPTANSVFFEGPRGSNTAMESHEDLQESTQTMLEFLSPEEIKGEIAKTVNSMKPLQKLSSTVGFDHLGKLEEGFQAYLQYLKLGLQGKITIPRLDAPFSLTTIDKVQEAKDSHSAPSKKSDPVIIQDIQATTVETPEIGTKKDVEMPSVTKKIAQGNDIFEANLRRLDQSVHSHPLYTPVLYEDTPRHATGIGSHNLPGRHRAVSETSRRVIQQSIDPTETHEEQTSQIEPPGANNEIDSDRAISLGSNESKLQTTDDELSKPMASLSLLDRSEQVSNSLASDVHIAMNSEPYGVEVILGLRPKRTTSGSRRPRNIESDTLDRGTASSDQSEVSKELWRIKSLPLSGSSSPMHAEFPQRATESNKTLTQNQPGSLTSDNGDPSAAPYVAYQVTQPTGSISSDLSGALGLETSQPEGYLVRNAPDTAATRQHMKMIKHSGFPQLHNVTGVHNEPDQNLRSSTSPMVETLDAVNQADATTFHLSTSEMPNIVSELEVSPQEQKGKQDDSGGLSKKLPHVSVQRDTGPKELGFSKVGSKPNISAATVDDHDKPKLGGSNLVRDVQGAYPEGDFLVGQFDTRNTPTVQVGDSGHITSGASDKDNGPRRRLTTSKKLDIVPEHGNERDQLFTSGYKSKKSKYKSKPLPSFLLEAQVDTSGTDAGAAARSQYHKGRLQPTLSEEKSQSSTSENTRLAHASDLGNREM